MRNLSLLLGVGLMSACQGEGGIFVANVPPTAEIQSPDAESALLFQGIPATFRGHVQDRDNLPEELEATWYIGEVAVCEPETPNSSGETFCDITLDAGDTEVRLAVRDRGGLSGFHTQTFWARPSAEPTAEITSLNPTTQYFADQPIDFAGIVSDVEDEPTQLVAWWESSIDGDLSEVAAEPSSAGTVSGVGFLSEGDHQIRLYVEDRAGNVTFDTTVIRVGPPNRSPICGGITNPLDNGVVRSGSTVVFTALATDPDVAANFLTATWDSDKDGQLGVSAPNSDGQITFPYNGLTTDSHFITLTVEDEFGQVCTSSILLVVDSPPTVDLTSPQPNFVYELGEPISFTAVATDNEDPETSLTVAWEDDLNGSISTVRPGADGTLSFSRSDMQVGEHLLTLTVTDSSGLDTQVQVPYTVNALPSTPGIAITPTEPGTLDTLTGTVTVPSVDPDNHPVDYRRVWYLDGVVQLGQTGWTIPAGNTEKGDVWRLEVTPFDPYGDGPTTSVSATIRNTAPQLDAVTINGGPYFESSTLTCSPGTSSDADGDAVSFTYSWLVNGAAVPASGTTLTGARFSRGDQVQCTATPTDGSLTGLLATSNTVTINNTPPEVSNPHISPETPEGSDTLTCTVDFADEDGDPSESTYTWRSAGNIIGTGSTFTGSLAEGQVVTCTVVASDGTATGNSVSTSVTIAPSAPSIDNVIINPAVPLGTDVLSCLYSGYSDPQGDADRSRYQWTVNGDARGTTATLSSGFAKGDTVMCTVTPSDGTNDGTPDSASVLINNTPPTAPVAEISPAFPLSGLDDVVCSLRTRSTDADGDSVTYQFEWTMDGNPFFGAVDAADSSTVSANDFAGLEDLVCTVTPSDDDGAGPSDSASVTTLPSIDPKLGVGGSHSCALNRRGEVSCWGLSQDGRILAPSDIFLDLDGALNFTCGIAEDSTLDCWGLLETAGGAVIATPTGTFTNISASDDTACATRTAGGVLCWGSDDYNLITDAPQSAGVVFTDIAVGQFHACGLRASGQISCWGDNRFSQRDAPSGTFTRLAAGSLHTCAVRTDGTLACWGNNGDNKATPPAGNDFIEVGAGVRHSCAIHADGTAQCWGYNGEGRATPPTTGQDGNPIDFAAIDLWIHTCAVDQGGQAYCWGRDEEGQSSPP